MESLETRSLTSTHESVQPVSTTLVSAPGNSQDLVVRAVHLLQTEDADMPPRQCTVLIMVLGVKNNERFLEFYVSLTDKVARCPFIEKLITDVMVP